MRTFGKVMSFGGGFLVTGVGVGDDATAANTAVDLAQSACFQKQVAAIHALKGPNGGLSALIDLESGVLSAAAERGEDRLIMHDVHPDTGAQISSRVIPNWSALKEHVLEVANRLPFLC